MKILSRPILVIFGSMLIAFSQVSAVSFTNIYVFPTDGFNSSNEETNGDGVSPDSLVLVGNTLYGTAYSGGGNGGGTFFRVDTDGSHFTNLFNFTMGTYDPNTGLYVGSTGTEPNPGLLLVSNTFYGTAFYGGADDAGTVFKINLDGSGFSVIEDFAFTNGQGPSSGLTLYNNNLYGTTAGGGTNGYGTIFSINLGNLGFTEIYEFPNQADAYGGVAVSSNGIFGFAYSGGAFGDGFVYRDGFDLFDFNGTNGWAPYSTPTLSGNTLYGVTFQGGTNGSGNIFRIDTDGQNFTNLYNFSSADGANTDGVQPYDVAGLVLSGNILYGTAAFGGSGGQGTVFKISTSGQGFTVLHSFQYTDGGQPGQLVLSGGTLYGAALVGIQGISLGDGSIFKLGLHPGLYLALAGTNAVLTWNDPSYSLYSAPTLSSAFTEISGATSPYTNGITGEQKYFELQ
ncbi:MAG: choice-of-anchor tandem repeat GloVer-containing protein [Verrucomicrobiota bacterium]